MSGNLFNCIYHVRAISNALHTCSWYNHTVLMKLLLSHTANKTYGSPNLATSRGFHRLARAAMEGAAQLHSSRICPTKTNLKVNSTRRRPNFKATLCVRQWDSLLKHTTHSVAVLTPIGLGLHSILKNTSRIPYFLHDYPAAKQFRLLATSFCYSLPG